MNDSRPAYEKPPTFDEVVLYASQQKLLGKVDIRKFYDFYDRSGFQFHGIPMDWKAKLQEWASRQRSNVMITGEVQAVLNANKPLVSPIDRGLLDDLAEAMGFASFEAYHAQKGEALA